MFTEASVTLVWIVELLCLQAVFAQLWFSISSIA